MFGEAIYALTPRDLQQAQVETVGSDSGLQALASVSWETSLGVPQSKLFVLQSLAAFGQGTGGQQCNGIFVLLRPPGLAQTAQTRIAGRLEPTPLTTVELDRQFGAGLVLQPLTRIVVAGSFTAGVLANNLRLWCAGYFIPRGNIGIGTLVDAA